MDTTIDKYDYWLLRKPLQSDTIVENVLQHGVGGLNIDDCRIESVVDLSGYTPSGRWPANIVHDGSDEVTELFPDVKGNYGGKGRAVNSNSGIYGWNTVDKDKNNISDSNNKTRGVKDFGSAARFFYNVTQNNSIGEDIDQGDIMDTNNEDLKRQFYERVTLYLGNCLDVLKTMESNSVDSIVTDPPAGISFMNKQ